MEAARGYRDVAASHGADSERVDGAHGVEDTPAEGDPVAPVRIGEGIGADDPRAVKHDQITPAEFFEQGPDGRRTQPCALRKRACGRSSPAFEVELE